MPTRNVLNVVEAVGSRRVGDVREGQRRFPLVVRLPDKQRTDPDALAATLIPDRGRAGAASEPGGEDHGDGRPVHHQPRVGQAADHRAMQRARAGREELRGGRPRQRIAAQVKLPEGYTIEWGGQFENMERANRKLMFVVPMALALIFVLLFFSLKTLREVLIVASGIPLGLVGGVLALWLRGLPFTVSSAIGFIALSGVAILNGLVLVTFIKQKLDAGRPLEQAVREGCLVRLRPVLMTALVAAVGFIPMAVNVGVGGEVQRPLATVVIGGIFTNTLLTLLVLPALYVLAHKRHTTSRGISRRPVCRHAIAGKPMKVEPHRVAAARPRACRWLGGRCDTTIGKLALDRCHPENSCRSTVSLRGRETRSLPQEDSAFSHRSVSAHAGCLVVRNGRGAWCEAEIEVNHDCEESIDAVGFFVGACGGNGSLGHGRDPAGQDHAGLVSDLDPQSLWPEHVPLPGSDCAVRPWLFPAGWLVWLVLSAAV